MKEKALELKKQIFPMKEYIEQLNEEERRQLSALEHELTSIEQQLSDSDKEWINDHFGYWYLRLLEVETNILIKPDADCCCKL